ncbi:MAG: hypothetical protein IID41_06840 [Planctomycetes bacterium]|nr:hypothetical protein [Planctomycetota bacterium]
MTIEDQINATEDTATNTLRKALSRAEEEDWRGVLILGMVTDGAARFLKSAQLNDMEVVGLVRWASLLADDATLEDLTEPEEMV